MAGLLNLLQAFGLSTASGLNAYVPLLTVGLLARYTDLIHLNPPYDLLTHPLVLGLLAVLALLDFVADKVPVVDHAVHVAGLVVHPIAGAILFLAASGDAGTVHPVLAAACGVVLAGGTHTARMAARPVATATTAGAANPVVSFAEDVVSLLLSVLAVLIPVLAFLLILLLAVPAVLLLRRRRRRARAAAPRSCLPAATRASDRRWRGRGSRSAG
jgi:hypothetical protein